MVDIFSAMQTGKPYKSYIKTILGQVYVVRLDSFSNQPAGVLLKGNPRNKDEECIIDVWSEKEDVFFKRMNARLFKIASIIAYERPEVETLSEEDDINSSTDEELVTILNSKYLAFSSSVNKITSEGALFRLLGLARENEKSEKYIKFIELRLATIQNPVPIIKENNDWNRN